MPLPQEIHLQNGSSSVGESDGSRAGPRADYGSTVFEGVRAYATPQGPIISVCAITRDACSIPAKIYRIDIPYSIADINAACKEIVTSNDSRPRRVFASLRLPRYGDRRRAERSSARRNASPHSMGAYLGPRASRTASMFA